MPTYVAFLRAINLGATRKFGKDAIAGNFGRDLRSALRFRIEHHTQLRVIVRGGSARPARTDQTAADHSNPNLLLRLIAGV